MVDSCSPFKFPLKLELRIFCLSARLNRRETILQLCLVSRHVHEWIKPILYESLAFYEDYQSAILSSSLHKLSSRFLETAIKNVFLHSANAVCHHILRSCTGIQSLVISLNTPYDVVAALRPTNLKLLPGCLTYRPGISIVNLPFFSQVTHLELFTVSFDDKLYLLPHLTHLAFDTHHWFSYYPARFADILQKCSNIQKLLALFDVTPSGRFEPEILQSLRRILPHTVTARMYLGKQQLFDDDWEDNLNGTTVWDKGASLVDVYDETVY